MPIVIIFTDSASPFVAYFFNVFDPDLNITSYLVPSTFESEPLTKALVRLTIKG